MGVKDLWSILSPVCERKPLWELQDKTIAVDLSCWVCESQSVGEHTTQPRMYLRNLFFRTACLVLLGVKPVFVLEGVAPTLKHNTIGHRIEQRMKKKCNASQAQPKRPGNRSRLQSLLKQCEKLLEIMGLSCIQSPGEAEAFCALLDQQGLVDGCITQDSDSFLYGAQTVYRNFTISPHGVGGSRGFSVDVYKMSAIEKKLLLGRNKLIAISLLCGCDYNEKGVAGVGKESVMKFIVSLKDEDVLKRLKRWRTDPYFDELERERTEVVKGVICQQCGHTGRRVKHDKNGCGRCGLSKGCVEDSSRQHLTDPSVLAELNVRKKALMDPVFPSTEMMQEFFQEGHSVQPHQVNKCWRQPDLITFIKYSVKVLLWTEMYALEKCFPLITRWQLLSVKKHALERTEIAKPQFIFSPQYIIKKRILKGVPSYEIQWSDDKDHLENVKLEDQILLETLLITVEPQGLIDDACPDLVGTFIAKKEAKCKQGKRKAKSKIICGGKNKENDGCSQKTQLNHFLNTKETINAPVNIENLFGSLSLKESKVTTERFTSKRIQKTGTQPKIVNFLIHSSKLSGCVNNNDIETYASLQDKGRSCSNELQCRFGVPEEKKLNSSTVNDVDCSSGNVSCDDCELCNSSSGETDSSMNLSAIIEGIVGTVTQKYVDTESRKCHENNDVTFKDQTDICTLTLSRKDCSTDGKSSSHQCSSKERILEDEFDSLGDVPYIPLFQRI